MNTPRPRLGLRHVLMAATLALVATAPAHAVDVGGVSLGDEAKVDGRSLTLNGAGIGMKAMLFKVYVMGLYLPSRKRTMAEIVTSDGPRRISISMLRKVSVDDFRSTVNSAVTDDSGSRGLEGFADQMNRLSDAMSKSGRDLQRGDTLTLDWLPDKGTVISINQQPVVEPIPGVDFYNALLDVWLGEKPTDASLKPKLLGVRERRLDQMSAFVQ